MAPYDTVEEYTRTSEGCVEHVRIRKTDDDKYPCGYDYTLHYGTTDGETLLRYDNAHERSKGHERHTRDDVTEITFPGMMELYERFCSEIEDL